MSTTTTREEVVEQAARATVKYDLWRKSDASARQAPRDRKKGEATARFPGRTADEIVAEFTEDLKEQCLLLHEANQRAKELRDL